MNAWRGFVDQAGKLTIGRLAAFKAYIRRFAGEEVDVDVRKRGDKRSDRQNKALHGMLTPWSHDEGYPIDELKRDLLIAVFGSKEATSPVTGEIVLVPVKPHTSKLTVRDFVEFVDRAVEIAAGCGVMLELPHEYLERKEREHAAELKRRQRHAA
jgi:hypothetical protein